MENRPWSDYLSESARSAAGEGIQGDLEGERYTRLSAAIDRIREHPMLANIDRQLALKLARILSIYSDTEAAWERYRQLSPSVQDQVLPLRGLDFASFAALHNDIQHLDITSFDPDERFETIQRIDANEVGHTETERTLEKVRESGLTIELDEGLMDDLRAFAEYAPREDYRRRLPLLELFKNDKRATINGLHDSKLSLIVHDSFDHMWGFDFAERTGLAEKYAGFLGQVGDPAHTDMYNRQSELIATVLFGYRIFKDTDNSFQPTFDIEKVRRVLETQRLHHHEGFTQNQADALSILNSITNPHEISLMGYSISNIHDEIVEQRRKHGRVQLLDTATGEPDRPLRTLEPEYVAFVVEMLHQLFCHEQELKHDLIASHVLTERYLHNISLSKPGTKIEPFRLSLTNIHACDPYDPTLREAGQADWFTENAGAIANKYRPHGRPKDF